MHGLSRYSVGQWPCALDGYVSRIHNANFSLIGHRHDPRPACTHTHTRTCTRTHTRVRTLSRSLCLLLRARTRPCTRAYTQRGREREREVRSPQVVRGKEGVNTRLHTFAMPRCSPVALNEPRWAERAKNLARICRPDHASPLEYFKQAGNCLLGERISW